MVRLSLLALALFAAPALSGAQVSCQKRDPVTGACVGAPVAAAGRGLASPTAAADAARDEAQIAIPMPPGVVGPLGGVYSASGMFGCMLFDESTQRCVRREPSEEERQRAMNSGIEAAMSGLRIQGEINRRMQVMGMGAGPQQAPQGVLAPQGIRPISQSAVPTPSQGQQAQQPASQATLTACFESRLRQQIASAGRALSVAESDAVLKECQR